MLLNSGCAPHSFHIKSRELDGNHCTGNRQVLPYDVQTKLLLVMSLNFNQFALEANHFLKEYTEKLHLDGDTDKAGRILSSILHALREVISVEESLQLMAQLPMFLKAVYVNEWTLRNREKVRNTEEFIDLIRKFDGITSIHDFATDDLAENYIHATFIMLRKYVSLGELEDIRTELPKDLKSLVYDKIMF